MQIDCLIFALEFAKEHLFYLKCLERMETYIDGLKKAGLTRKNKVANDTHPPNLLQRLTEGHDPSAVLTLPAAAGFLTG